MFFFGNKIYWKSQEYEEFCVIGHSSWTSCKSMDISYVILLRLCLKRCDNCSFCCHATFRGQPAWKVRFGDIHPVSIVCVPKFWIFLVKIPVVWKAFSIQNLFVAVFICLRKSNYILLKLVKIINNGFSGFVVLLVQPFSLFPYEDEILG